MALDNRTQKVGGVGTILKIQKQPAEKFKVTVNCEEWLGTDTIASVTAAVFNPSGAEAPTLATPVTKGTDNVSAYFVIQAGTVAWNTTGVGAMSFTFTTTTSQEVKEVNFEIAIVDY